MDTTPIGDGLQIGPLNLTLQQVSVGIITNLIVFPPSFLLVQLFKRTKRRHSHLSKLRKILDEHNSPSTQSDIEKTQIKTRKNRVELKFPWWFKFVTYGLSITIACVCLFFVIVKGIVLGNDKVTKWITSVVISFLSSILITQPLQVCLGIIF